MASWRVLTPNGARASTSSREARVILRWTTPSSCMCAPCGWARWACGGSAALLLQQCVQPRVDGAGVVLLDAGQVRLVQSGGLDVAAGVVEVVPRARVDVADRA